MIKFPYMLALGMAVLLSCTLGFAKTLTVPGDAATIQGGIDLSDDGDTVMVLPGVYMENIYLENKLVSVISTAGPGVTKIQPENMDSPIISVYSWKGAHESGRNTIIPEISGFTITGGGDSPTIYIYDAPQLIISDNIIHDNIPIKITDKAVILCQGELAAPRITGNIFYGNYGVTCIQVLAGAASIINNTFDGNSSAFISSSGTAEALNNIVVNSLGIAVDGTFFRLDYNDVWNNFDDYG